MFAVIGKTLFGEVAPDDFGSIFTSMISLFACMTLNRWADLWYRIRQRSSLFTDIHPSRATSHARFFKEKEEQEEG
ncbi:hypothetical protein HMI54_004699 [Coelomomyces lativittatus]|nr:hypothetical protein HMI54_004699 [Coelomomyces lativittatus]